MSPLIDEFCVPPGKVAHGATRGEFAPGVPELAMIERMRALPTLLIIGVAIAADSTAQQSLQNPPIRHDSGQSVTPSFEGWYRNPDGTFSLSFGYFNRNYREEPDIPTGPNNKLEPGPVDRGQPTHFLTRRQTGVFTVVVPKDFGSQKLTWTITAHGQTNSIPGHLRPEWEIDALKEVTSGNTPPVIKFDPNGRPGQGPSGVTTALKVTMPNHVALTVWAMDDNVRKRENEGRPGPALGLVWSKYRGPGRVTFGDSAPEIDDTGKAATTATFSEPGAYTLRVLAWDASGAQGPVMAVGFQCCWTNGYVNVTVTPALTQNR